MDALSDVLKVAHLTGGVFLHADFFAPWCLSARVAPEHCAPNLGPASHLILITTSSRATFASESTVTTERTSQLGPARLFCCRAMTCI